MNRRIAFDVFFLVFSFSILTISTIHAAVPMDEDAWWHLRTGIWILAHHAVPRQDLFSATAAGKPWIVYDWVFDVCVPWIFDSFGYRGMLALITFTMMAYVAWMVVFLASLTNPRRGMILAFSAYIALVPLKSPRPWLFTMLFFAIELTCLWLARRKGQAKWLLPLVPLFALWANVHVQFVYGLGIVALFAVDAALPNSLRAKISAEPAPPLRASALWIALAACLLATLLNPYGWNVYRVVYQFAANNKQWDYIQERQAIPFRTWSNWLVLLLTGGAIFRLGCAPKKSLLLIFALVCSSYFGFHSQRDTWFLVTIAVLAIASSLPATPREPGSREIFGIGIPLSFATTFLFLIASSRFSNAALHQKNQERFPEEAAAYIDAHHLPGPLFNSFNWGGYLIWRLPSMPVSIDGRATLYDSLEVSAKTFAGASGWSDDPDLKRSHTILIEHDSPLASILRVDPRFRLLYEDKVASVFQPVAQPLAR